MTEIQDTVAGNIYNNVKYKSWILSSSTVIRINKLLLVVIYLVLLETLAHWVQYDIRSEPVRKKANPSELPEFLPS